MRVESFESFEKNSQWDYKSLDLNNFQIKMNLKKVKTLKGRLVIRLFWTNFPENIVGSKLREKKSKNRREKFY